MKILVKSNTYYLAEEEDIFIRNLSKTYDLKVEFIRRRVKY